MFLLYFFVSTRTGGAAPVSFDQWQSDAKEKKASDRSGLESVLHVCPRWPRQRPRQADGAERRAPSARAPSAPQQSSAVAFSSRPLRCCGSTVGRRRRRRRARAPGRGLRRLWKHSRARSCISAAQALVGHSCPERASGARLPWDAIGCSGSSRHHPNDAQGPSASLSVPALVHAVTRSNVSR